MKRSSIRHSSSIFYILGALLPVILLISCSTSKNSVVIVSSKTVSTTKPDTTTVSETTNNSFQSITIGENQPIRSLDPLFITNVSEMRAVQLVYEGLVRFNSQGKIVPSIAKSWTISNNHRQFQFILKQNIYFQDSPIFQAAAGARSGPVTSKRILSAWPGIMFLHGQQNYL